jgi:hypothetical protein
VRAYFVIFSIICAMPGLWIMASRRINAVDADRINPMVVIEQS